MAVHFEDSSVVIHKLKCGPYDNNAYLVVCPETRESIVIDAPADPGSLIEAARTTTVKAVVITHSHSDHILGLAEVRSALGAPVGIGEPDAGALDASPDFLLRDGEEVRAGTVGLRAISTPGHTPGSTCLAFGDHLFTGDTLFPGGPGKTGTPDRLRQVVHSITSRLFTLGDQVAFYPGHGDDSGLGTARAEYRVFSSRDHEPGLCGDVLWLES
jgi:glyoxylase-like metal-dependent hydrolase (beta-lactamase superfamily II)